MERLRNLQAEVVNPTLGRPLIVGRSEVEFGEVNGRSAQRVAEILKRMIKVGIFNQDLASVNPTIGQLQSTEERGVALIHKINGTVYVNMHMGDSRDYFVHARFLHQNPEGSYVYAKASAIPEPQKINVITGLCLFSYPTVTAIGEDGTSWPFLNPNIGAALTKKIADIEVADKLSIYEADAVLRLSAVLSSLNPEKVNSVALHLPRLEYGFLLLDAYEDGLIDQDLVLRWFELVQRRAEGIGKLVMSRVKGGHQMKMIEPLKTSESLVKEAVTMGQRELLHPVVDLLRSSDPIWKKIFEVAGGTATITKFSQLTYLSLVAAYLKQLETSAFLVAVEDPMEIGILTRTKELIGQVMNKAFIIGLYVHPNLILTDPDVIGSRSLFYYNPGETYTGSITDAVRVNRPVLGRQPLKSFGQEEQGVIKATEPISLIKVMDALGGLTVQPDRASPDTTLEEIGMKMMGLKLPTEIGASPFVISAINGIALSVHLLDSYSETGNRKYLLWADKVLRKTLGTLPQQVRESVQLLYGAFLSYFHYEAAIVSRIRKGDEFLNEEAAEYLLRRSGDASIYRELLAVDSIDYPGLTAWFRVRQALCDLQDDAIDLEQDRLTIGANILLLSTQGRKPYIVRIADSLFRQSRELTVPFNLHREVEERYEAAIASLR